MINHHFHIVLKGDSLTTTAKKYNITTEELRRYHNTHCELKDLLGHEITHQQKLFVPIAENEFDTEGKIENEQRKVNFAPGNKLSYFPINSHYKYGVMIILENENGTNEIKYEASVKWIQKFGESHIFEIDRISKIFINEEEPNDIADLLAYKTSMVLFPMQLMVDKDGGWIEVAKCNLYPDRWKQVRKEILQEFEGEVVEEYLHKVERILETPEQINIYMLGDFFLRTLFLGYCGDFGEDYKQQFHIGFPIVENGIEPKFLLQSKISPMLDDYNLINIEMEGVLDDMRSKSDFINSSPFPTEMDKNEENISSSFLVKAFLNPNSCIPESIFLSCQLYSLQKVTVVIANLSDSGKINIRNKESLVIDKIPQRKNSFLAD